MEIPTRQSNILDLLISNNPEKISSVQAGPSMIDAGLPSDHYPFTFAVFIHNKLKCALKNLIYNLKNADLDSLNNSFLNLPLSSGVRDIKSQENLDYMWLFLEFWNDMVFSAINSFVFLCMKKPCDSNSLPWINGEGNLVEVAQERS